MISPTVLVASATPEVGVKVPTQVLPPSVLLRGLKVPLSTVTSLLSKPVTFSLKVMVSWAVSEASRVLLLSAMEALGP